MLFERRVRIAVLAPPDECARKLASVAKGTDGLLGSIHASMAAFSDDLGNDRLYSGSVSDVEFRLRRPSISSSPSFWPTIQGSITRSSEGSLVMATVGYRIPDVILIGFGVLAVWLLSAFLVVAARQTNDPVLVPVALAIVLPIAWAVWLRVASEREARRFRNVLAVSLGTGA